MVIQEQNTLSLNFKTTLLRKRKHYNYSRIYKYACQNKTIYECIGKWKTM